MKKKVYLKCMSRKKTTEEFIREARKVHGDKYDYSETVYESAKKKVIIVCKKHGKFEQSPTNHLNGQGCPACYGNKKLTREVFIERAKKIHNNFYTYENLIYKNVDTKIEITCPIHGSFWQRADHHLEGCGCPKCKAEKSRDSLLSNTEKFILQSKQIHGEKYNYENVEYKDSHTPVIIGCETHGDFNQTPEKHLRGHGCPMCGLVCGQKESEISNFLKENGLNVEKGNRNILDGKEIDIYIPDKKIGFEYNGLRWHSELFDKDKNYHLEKTKKAEEKGIKLYHIFEDEYIGKKNIVIEKIKNILHLSSDKKTIGGRDTFIKTINKDIARNFLESYHIQGFTNSTVYIGAFDKNSGLTAVMSFKKQKTEGEWELTRFATDYHYKCPGIGSKLFHFFIRNFNPRMVKSFADRRWTLDRNDNLYIKMGFVLEKVLPPDYKYNINGQRVHKFNLRKEKIRKKYGFPLSMTEKAMCEKLGFYRVWDCGLFKYVWISKT